MGILWLGLGCITGTRMGGAGGWASVEELDCTDERLQNGRVIAAIVEQVIWTSRVIRSGSQGQEIRDDECELVEIQEGVGTSDG